MQYSVILKRKYSLTPDLFLIVSKHDSEQVFSFTLNISEISTEMFDFQWGDFGFEKVANYTQNKRTLWKFLKLFNSYRSLILLAYLAFCISLGRMADGERRMADGGWRK